MINFAIKKSVILIQSKKGSHIDFVFDAEMHMDHKFSEIDHVTPLFKFFLVVHLQTHSDLSVKVTKNFNKGVKWSISLNL